MPVLAPDAPRTVPFEQKKRKKKRKEIKFYNFLIFSILFELHLNRLITELHNCQCSLYHSAHMYFSLRCYASKRKYLFAHPRVI